MKSRFTTLGEKVDILGKGQGINIIFEPCMMSENSFNVDISQILLPVKDGIINNNHRRSVLIKVNHILAYIVANG